MITFSGIKGDSRTQHLGNATCASYHFMILLAIGDVRRSESLEMKRPEVFVLDCLQNSKLAAGRHSVEMAT